MPEDITRLVVEGFEQGLSAKRHMETEESATFTDENDVPQITLTRNIVRKQYTS